jgi:prevent-host-death family protein
MSTWQLQEAKNRLSELIERALSEGPQVITRHGVEVAVVMPFSRYRKLTESKVRLGDLLLTSPLRKGDLVIERDKRRGLRKLDL